MLGDCEVGGLALGGLDDDLLDFVGFACTLVALTSFSASITLVHCDSSDLSAASSTTGNS